MYILRVSKSYRLITTLKYAQHQLVKRTHRAVYRPKNILNGTDTHSVHPTDAETGNRPIGKYQ